MGDVLELLAIACEKNRPTSRSIPNTDNVALYILWTVSGWSERLVESTMTRRNIGDGRFVVAYTESVHSLTVKVKSCVPGNRKSG